VTFDAILLASFGGPEGPDEVMPFLERVTAGRGVPRERLEAVSHHYLALGGVSPINAQNRELLVHLRAEMDQRGIDVPLYWGNRNSEPFFVDTVREIHESGHRRVLAVATSAYSSYSGCRQYRENLAAAIDEAGLAGELEIAKAWPYYERSGFVEPFIDGVVEALAHVSDPASARVLFTTHSIPDAMAEGSGPDDLRNGLPGLYERQHLDVARRVMTGVESASGLSPIEWQLVFQSRSGPPQVPWLEPDIGDAVREASAQGASAVIVVPIGFVSDHVEVIWDLDNEAQEIAEEIGIEFARVATPGVDPRFVKSLVDVMADAMAGVPTASEPRLCSQTCCRNARADLPNVVGC
jgi:protoporphyrin/coproporphyrin ferrochelatase